MMKSLKVQVINDVKVSKRLMQCEKYVEFGYSVIPLVPKGKKSLIAWKEYESRRANIEEIKEWLRKNPEANIGIVTGRISNLIVLDVDGKEGVNSLRTNNYKIPETAKAETGKGYHYYLKYPEDYEIGNFVGILPKVDIRGEGGYVVAPPSLYSTGKKYKWLRFTEPAEVPDWLLNLTIKPNHREATSIKGNQNMQYRQAKLTKEQLLEKLNNGINEGERNETLTILTGYLFRLLDKRKNKDTYEVLETIQHINKTKCNPPLEDKEIQTIVESIAGREVQKLRGRI